MGTDGDDDFEFSSKPTRIARYISADNFDDYIDDESLKAYIKSIDTRHEFTTITTTEFPSSISIVFRTLRKKYGYGAHQIEDVLVYYGLKMLWNILKETKLEELSHVIDSARKYANIPELKTKYLYKPPGDSKRVVHIHNETAAFCSELATKLDVSNSSICMLSMLLALRNSPTILNNFDSINETFLFQLNDNIFNSSEQFFKELVMWLCGYCNPIYNLYCKKILQSDSSKKQLSEMYEILVYARKNGYVIDSLIDYKSITINYDGIKISVVNDTKKEQIPEFDEPKKVYEQPVYTIKDKSDNVPELVKVSSESLPESKPESKPPEVEPVFIEKQVIIEKPEETDIKKVISHLLKLILNRLHLSKK